MEAKDKNPPDGGYGWIVVMSAFVVMGLTGAVLKTFGLFVVEFQQHFDKLASTTSWIISITITIFHLGAPFASSLCVRYSHRAVVIMGGLLAFSGMALGFLGRNITWMCATTGFLQGLGISFSWTPAISIVNRYFSKKRSLASAVASAGECAFAFLFGPFCQRLIGKYGWKGAFLIIGGVQLNICVCGVLMRSLASSCLLEASHSENCSETETLSGNSTSRIDKEDKANITCKVFNWMLVSYSLGIVESQTVSLLSILAMVDFAGRLLCGWYANLCVTRTVNLLTITITLMGTSLMLLPLAKNYLSLAIFTGIYGFFFGTTVAVHITALEDVVGMPDFDSALGLFMFIRSTGGFVGPTLAGLIVEKTGDYRAGFYMAGVTFLLSAGFLVTLDQFRRRKGRQSQTNTKPDEPTLYNPSLHHLKLHTRRYQEHDAMV